MVSQQERVFSISNRPLLLLWGSFLLLFASTVFVPFMIATNGQEYPDLSVAPVFCAAFGFIWIPLLAEQRRQTIRIELGIHHFTVKKLGHTPKQFDYNAILAHNERMEVGREGTFNALTVYLKDDFFIIKSNEFEDYELLRDLFSQYGQTVTYQKVMALAERNRLRWMIGGLALFIAANIAFGYVAHNPANPNPARLVTVTDMAEKVTEERPKGTLKGVNISLRSYPAFSFYVSRREYDIRLDTLKWVIATGRPIELLIRESDYRKKLMKTESLTFGDKFDNYKLIMVYGVKQGDSVHLQTTKPVYAPTHTKPGLRTFFLSVLLLFCWTGWVYVDRHKVLRAG